MARTVTLDTAQLARFLDITPRHVFRLTNDGVLVRARDEAGNELRGRYELLPNNVSYIRHLRQQGRFDDASESEYQRQRVGQDACGKRNGADQTERTQGRNAPGDRRRVCNDEYDHRHEATVARNSVADQSFARRENQFPENFRHNFRRD